MKKRLPWILLIVSAAFNVFLIAGTLAARARHAWMRTPEGRAAVLADELDMDGEQRAACQKLVVKSEAERRGERERHGAEFATVWRELARAEPDEGVMEAFVRVPSEPDMRRRFVEDARALMAILRPEQRERVAEVMMRLRRGRPR